MVRKVLCGALTLAVMTAASASEAMTFDCWKLDGGKLAEARSMGLCQDVFAPTKPPTPSQPAETKRVRTNKVERAEASPRPAPANRASSNDLGQRFRNDVNALGNLLGGIFSDGRSSRNWKGVAKPLEHEYDLP